MRILAFLLAALATGSSISSLAQTIRPTNSVDASGPAVVSKIQLRLVFRDRPPELLSGRLWRHPLVGDARPVASVNAQGQLDEPYRCFAGDRLVGKPFRAVSIKSESQPCRNGIEFEFNAIRTVRLVETPGSGAISISSYLAAYSDLQSINNQAAEAATGDTKMRYLAAAQAAQTAMIWVSAKALGDDELESLVTLDPAQGNRLVLSKEGVSRLEQLQRSKKLKVTGQLDFATLELIGAMTTPDALKGPGQELFVLPSDLFRDKAVLSSPNKSAGLVELSRAARKGN